MRAQIFAEYMKYMKRYEFEKYMLPGTGFKIKWMGRWLGVQMKRDWPRAIGTWEFITLYSLLLRMFKIIHNEKCFFLIE